MCSSQRRVLVIGAGFSGLAAARDLKDPFLVTIVDAKEFFEYTPGILRAYVKPKQLDALTFTLYPVIERRMHCKFLWGEVTELNGVDRTATIRPRFGTKREIVDFDFCVVAAGCNYGVFHKWGESLWFPTIHAAAREEGSWPHLDERFLEGRRRHILEEHKRIRALNDRNATVLVIGAGFIGVEWATELQHFFPNLQLTIVDFLPKCLGPLPANASAYCSAYMERRGIKQFYSVKFAPKTQEFWDKIQLPQRADKEYVCIGVRSSNFFMPLDTLSEKGPGGGGWVLMDKTLAVKTRDGKAWSVDEHGHARIYTVGDCNFSCVEEPGKDPSQWPIPPIPKISYPGEEEAVIAVSNIIKIDKLVFRGLKKGRNKKPLAVHDMHWPWGAGMFAISLGPYDGCFVAGANWTKNSGRMCLWGSTSALQKGVIEASKVDECAHGRVGRALWYFIHHTPIHLFGGGPLRGY